MNIELHMSPCPNDTFMFEAMINRRVHTDGISFLPVMHDIELLNANALKGLPVLTKISYAILPGIADRYLMLESGSALGRGNGPLLVAKDRSRLEAPELKIAVPGLNTTANMLIDRFYPHFTRRTPVVFSEIAPRIATGEFDAGVLIHEGRFTYQGYGLELISDLGLEWEASTGMPLPLGGIAVSRNLPKELRNTVSEIMQSSISYAFENPDAGADFVQRHAQEMSPEVIRKHIGLFVNRFSVELGAEGRGTVSFFTGMKEDMIFESNN